MGSLKVVRSLHPRRFAALLAGAAFIAGTLSVGLPLTVHAGPPTAGLASQAAAATAGKPLIVTPAPVVYAISPGSGPTVGGTTATIFGSGFMGATDIKFGSANVGCGGGIAGGFFVISDTQISVVTPAHALGTVDVVVVGPGGSSVAGAQDRFTFVSPTAPVVYSVDPVSGPTAGGTLVTIHGTGFTNASRAFFGTIPAGGFAPSDTLFQVTSPPRTAGTVDVTVVNSFGSSAVTNGDKFTFTAAGAPVVRAVAPNSGPAAGGTSVLVVGSGFSGASAIHFGATSVALGVFNVFDDSHIFLQAPPGTAATTVDVTVTNAAGTSAVSNADRFSYIAAALPVVEAVFDSMGPIIGGTPVSLTGSGFTGATMVKFGANAATGVNVNDDGHLFMTSPPGAVGTVDITVVTPVGTSVVNASDHFTYTATPAPVVFGVTPNSGTTSGQTFVSIIGAGFTGTTAVHFGATLATNNLFVNENSISVAAPAGAAGTVDIRVTTPAGNSAITTGDKFTYRVPGRPVVSAVGPNHGAPAGGDSVQLNGSGFTGVTAVHFGAVAATFFNSFQDTQLSVTSPPGTNGTTVDITVTSPAGTSTVSSADHFKYVMPGPPVVTAVGPPSGSVAGGTTVWVSGSAFSGATSVSFGTTAVFNIQLVSDNVIQVFGSPNGALGTVDVTVTTAGGTSAISSADHFTYTAAPVPAVSSVGPATGPPFGGTTVYISGTGFSGATSLKFGPTAVSFGIDSSTLIQATSPAGTAGSTVDITVVGPGGTSATSAKDQFTYSTAGPPPPPVVSTVGPSSGPAAGGPSNLWITGSNLSGATQVSFGANTAGFFVISSNVISVTFVPAGTAGTVDVTVTTPSGTSTTSSSDHYTYVNVPPTVSAIGPGTGPSAGGTTVWISGTGFSTATGVSFGLNHSFSFTIASDGLIQALSPAGTGTVDITVTSPSGTSATSANDQFVYGGTPPPGLQVDAVSPTQGPEVGQTNVEIAGKGFTGATAVMFGATPAAFFFVSSDTIISANSPFNQLPGTVDVTVTAGGITSAATKSDHFTFVAPGQPVVDAIDPNHGSSAGGTSVIIYGSGLSGTSTVTFGGGAPISAQSFSDSSVQVISPVGVAGTSVDVTVTNSAGTSATSSADLFTYVTPPVPEVDAVDPRSGSTFGGTNVTIFGSGFSGATSIQFGSTNAFPNFVTDGSINLTAPAGTLGSVDVTVTTPGGTSATGNADKFTYVAPGAPVVDAVSPNRGGTAGGRTVQIFGSGFAGFTGTVQFGNAQGTAQFLGQDGQMAAISPPGVVGTVDITVSTSGGTSATGAFDRYTYFVAPPPTVTGVSPNSGLAGSSLYINGTGLSDATSVFFAAACVGVFNLFNISDTVLQVFAPPGPSGTVDVTVLSPDGLSATSVNDRFTYTGSSAPTVTNVAPNTGPSGGATTVYITGTGLTAVTGVMFGSVPVMTSGPRCAPFGPCGFFAIDDTLLQATSPPGTAGTVDVTVTSPGGTSAITSADHFIYAATPVPAVQAVSPSSGPIGGGDPAFITGTGFLDATQVNFGATVLTPCFFFRQLTPSQATPTPRSAGAVVSPRFPIARQVPIQRPGLTAGTTNPRFATILVPSTARPAVPPTYPRSPVPLAGGGFPGLCTSGFDPVTDNLIELVTPAGSAGIVDVTVTAVSGTSSTSAADKYTYVTPPAPVVSAVSPSGGTAGGGTTVYVSGSHLSNATAVKFGGVAAAMGSDPFLTNPFQTTKNAGDSVIVVLAPPAAGPGTVHVTVTTAGGTSASTSADQYTYGSAPTPTVSAIGPVSGPIGTTVFVTGSGFLGATAVDFGSTPAIHSHAASTGTRPLTGGGLTGFFVISDDLIQAIAPSNSVGVLHVTVVTPGGTSSTSAADQFTYTASPTPAVTAIGPTAGPAGTVDYVTGSGFTGASAVSFGGTAATKFFVMSDTLIQVTSPAGSGTVDVTVTTPGGTSTITAADKYTYASSPNVTSVAPNTGPGAGGTSVTITGTNFTGVSSVKFGTTAAAFTFNSATQITATSPGGAGVVDVNVTTPAGTSAASSADQFTYSGPLCTTPTLSTGTATSPYPSGAGAITLTATGFCAGGTQYEFLYKDTAGTLHIIGSGYGSSKTAVWNADFKAGSYTLYVALRPVGSSASFVTFTSIAFTLTGCAVPGLTAAPASPQPAATSVTWTATVTCTRTPQFEFLVKPSTGSWSVVQAYGASMNFVWTSHAAGSYSVAVVVRNLGAAEDTFDNLKVASYTFT